MTIRKGVCTNIDGCSKAQQDIVQEIDDSEEFICTECGHELEDFREPKKKSNKPLIIGIAAVAIIAIGVLCYFMFRSPEKEETIVVEQPTTVEEVVEVATDTVIEAVDSLTAVVEEPVEVEPQPEEKVEEKHVKKTSEPKPKKDAGTVHQSSGTHQLGYATWNGTMRGGKPHGNGTMTYRTSHLIDSRDPKGRTARSGEYVIGEWDNGNLVQGRWFKNDGSKEVIIIGKAG